MHYDKLDYVTLRKMNQVVRDWLRCDASSSRYISLLHYSLTLIYADNASREHSRDQSCRVRMISRRHSIIAVRAVSHIDEINIECETLDLKDVYSEISPEARRVRLTLRPPNCSSFIKDRSLSLGNTHFIEDFAVSLRIWLKNLATCALFRFQTLLFYIFFVF